MESPEDVLGRYPDLKPGFDTLVSLERLHLDIGTRVMKARGGAFYLADHVVLGVLKRSLDLLDGMQVLVRRWNFVAAAPLLRLQLDNLLRFHYLGQQGFSDELSKAMLSDEPLYKFKDHTGRQN